MPDTHESKRLHDLATELLKSEPLDVAISKLASLITDDFALATTVAADYLSRVVVVERQS